MMHRFLHVPSERFILVQLFYFEVAKLGTLQHEGGFRANGHAGHAHIDFLSSRLSLSSFALFLGLSSHSIFEGIALGVQVMIV